MQNVYNETFIVSFAPGSSGKFLANIIWRIYHNLTIDSVGTMFNSCHNPAKFYNTVRRTGLNYSEINYKNITWVPLKDPSNPVKIGLFYTHIFPKIDDIQNNCLLDDTKFIVIRPCYDSLLEVMGNSIYKNNIQKLLGGNINFKDSSAEWLYHDYVKEFGYVHEKDFKNILQTDKDGIQILIKNSYEHTLDTIQQGQDLYTDQLSFLNCNIPDQIKDRTLVIDYLDLFQKTNTGYLALDKLEEFTNKKANAHIKFRYQEYVNGRTQFIKDYLYNLVPLLLE